MKLLASEGTFSLERFDDHPDDSGPDHLLDGVSRQGVEEHGEEEGEEDDEDDLEDRPLVVVPDDVPGQHCHISICFVLVEFDKY